MKKGTAIFFVVFANLIIMAHAIVPHHHHCHHQAFTLTDFLSTENCDHNYPLKNQHHDHKNADHQDFCLLDQVVSTPVNFTKQNYYTNAFLDFDLSDLSAINSHTSYDYIPPPTLPKPQNPFHSQLYTCSSNSVSGLRAPPTA